MAEKKLNILIGVHQFFPDFRNGTEVLTLELARGLRTRGHSVQVLSGAPEQAGGKKSPPWLTQDRYEDIPVHRLHFAKARLQDDPLALHFSAPERIRLIQDLVARLRPDLVHFNHIMGFSAQIIPEIKKMGTPVIFTPTDFWTVCPIATLYKPFDRTICNGPEAAECVRCFSAMPIWASRLAVKAAQLPFLGRMSGAVRTLYSVGQRLKFMTASVNVADRVLPSTRFLAAVLTGHGVDAGRIKVVPYGIDIGRVPERTAIPPHFTEASPLRLGFIGTLAELKGPHVILDALSLLGNKGRQLIVDIYGKLDPTAPYCGRLLRKADQLGAGVRFKGTFSHEKIGEIMSTLHLLAVPSLWYESTPLVLCSALAAGTPALVSRLGGMTEVVEDGVNGFSFPAGDAHALAKILASILDEPARLSGIRQRMKLFTRTTSDYVDDIEKEYGMATKGPLP